MTLTVDRTRRLGVASPADRLGVVPRGRADAVLCHHRPAHGIAGTASPHVRYARSFRRRHVGQAPVPWESMTDVWRNRARRRVQVVVVG